MQQVLLTWPGRLRCRRCFRLEVFSAPEEVALLGPEEREKTIQRLDDSFHVRCVFFKGWCGLDWVGLNLFLLGFFLRVGLAWIGLLLFFFFKGWCGLDWVGLNLFLLGFFFKG